MSNLLCSHDAEIVFFSEFIFYHSAKANQHQKEVSLLLAVHILYYFSLMGNIDLSGTLGLLGMQGYYQFGGCGLDNKAKLHT